ncbi:enoyl-CoA hydratase/isomerase family protein [Haloterrigena alkaliphila]|uniref:Enoyl-CoA hydratase/isomerase family protein n=1 Tax=Haloterrigena alkaliphila TaxID=2816475 RepID=A0A8A2VEP8_9EURY|nr:enoyl-CoA hydratase/isomerase family protein [Haloterrigena alkaliphila]QSW98832.1 enoyl-CoA hydratase/isomerase family protein [Haloterrigena alkaliphila]
MASSPLVAVGITDGIATVRLDRPDNLNAVTIQLLTDLRDALVDLPEDEVDGLVVTGAGNVTCAGMDREIVADPDYEEQYADEIAALTDEIYGFLTSRPYPTAVAARGALVGIGFILSLRCDFLVAGEETKLALPEVQFGIAATHTIPYLEAMTGTRVAKEIALTGEALAPERARELGIANRVVSENAVEEAATELVGTVAAHDADVVSELKAAMSDPA